MPSVSSAVRSVIEKKPMLNHALTEGIVNYANLAEKLHNEIEQDVGGKVDLPAIVMAIRRYAEKLKPLLDKKFKFKFNSEMIMKSGLVDLTLVKSPRALQKLKKIYDLVDFEKGETLNVIQGNYEITIVINEKYLKDTKNVLKEETIINTEMDLVSITLSFSEEFFYTPGYLAKITRKLAWENINVFENISTMTELIFIVGKKDAVRTYKALQEIVDEE
ncbi:MAG: hypothetical protein KKF44_01900 [Nanoarchaeota archaeon]|nr:hypothetical protein [Nanoarchaeota archaeon]